MLSGGGACIAGARPPPPRQRRRSGWGGRHASCGWSEGGSQLFTWLLAAVPRRVATSPVPATDPEHSEPGGAGVRGRALSGGSPRGARGAGAGPRGTEGPRFELLLGLCTGRYSPMYLAASPSSEPPSSFSPRGGGGVHAMHLSCGCAAHAVPVHASFTCTFNCHLASARRTRPPIPSLSRGDTRVEGCDNPTPALCRSTRAPPCRAYPKPAQRRDVVFNVLVGALLRAGEGAADSSRQQAYEAVAHSHSITVATANPTTAAVVLWARINQSRTRGSGRRGGACNEAITQQTRV